MRVVAGAHVSTSAFADETTYALPKKLGREGSILRPRQHGSERNQCRAFFLKSARSCRLYASSDVVAAAAVWVWLGGRFSRAFP